MSINRRIYEHLAGTAAGRQTTDVRIGLGYTAVMLENGQTGVAATPKTHQGHGCTLFDGMFPLTKRNTAELLAFLTSGDVFETAVGLAAANALANTDDADLDNGDVLEKIQITGKDRVAMVGHFTPMTKPIAQTGKVNRPVNPPEQSSAEKGNKSFVPPNPNMA